ncbi:MAG: Hsp20/alpha crystallin family protein [Bacteroidia bacterium]|jgi:HSP20 family protein|nr:Hsp20/alpha crystallin family protein [Bacteroidia bacterium]
MYHTKFAPARRNPMFFGMPFSALVNDSFFGTDQAAFVPAVNVSEDEKGFHLSFNAPGFEKEDFKVNIENNLLTVSAEHKAEVNEKEKNYTRLEFRYGSFSRSFRLPKDKVNEEGVIATYKNGILHLELPKREPAPAAAAKTIQVL